MKTKDQSTLVAFIVVCLVIVSIGKPGPQFGSENTDAGATEIGPDSFLAKQRPTDTRFLSYRALRLLAVPESNDAHARIFKAVDPDIIAIQGLRYSITREQIADWLNGVLPAGAPWHIHFGVKGPRGARMVFASRYGLSQPEQVLAPPMGDSYMGMALAKLGESERRARGLSRHRAPAIAKFGRSGSWTLGAKRCDRGVARRRATSGREHHAEGKHTDDRPGRFQL